MSFRTTGNISDAWEDGAARVASGLPPRQLSLCYAGLFIKQLPPELHRRLKDDAELHHGSMTRQALTLLESALIGSYPVRDLPPPFRGRFPITKRLVDRAKMAGRL